MISQEPNVNEKPSISQEPQEPEEYLFLYTYRIGKETYLYLDYFLDKQEAQAYLDQKRQPYISHDSVVEGCGGYTWIRQIEGRTAKTLYPHKKSEYDQLVEDETLTQFV